MKIAIGSKYSPGKVFEFRESGLYQALMIPVQGDMLVLQRALTAKPVKRTLWQKLMVV